MLNKSWSIASCKLTSCMNLTQETVKRRKKRFDQQHGGWMNFFFFSFFSDYTPTFVWPWMEKKNCHSNGTLSIQSHSLWFAIILWWYFNGGSNVVIIPKATLCTHTFDLSFSHLHKNDILLTYYTVKCYINKKRNFKRVRHFLQDDKTEQGK